MTMFIRFMIFGIHLFLLISGCSYEKKVLQTVEVNTEINEKCYFFKVASDTLKFKRSIKIVKNSISDTIILGYGVLFPKFIGYYDYSRFKGGVLDLNYPNPPADRICISAYKNRISGGELIFELIIITD